MTVFKLTFLRRFSAISLLNNYQPQISDLVFNKLCEKAALIKAYQGLSSACCFDGGWFQSVCQF